MNNNQRIETALTQLTATESLAVQTSGNRYKSLLNVAELENRLAELLEGREVPVPIFQCIDFEWIAAQTGEYPQAVARTDVTNPIVGFYEDEILSVRATLANVGKPKLLIIIPDSELYDSRPFSFAQSLQEREQLTTNYMAALPNRLAKICDVGGAVMLWSEYCKSYGLTSPFEYTTQNREMIRQSGGKEGLENKVRKQARDSRGFLVRNCGLNPTYVASISNEVMEERVGWYLAMYAGEGQALLESRAMPLNLEDPRVPTWFQRGAGNQLPLLTPVNPYRFYDWRKGQGS